MRPLLETDLAAAYARHPFLSMSQAERRAAARGWCGNPQAPFPLPLRDWLDVGYDGNVDFNYAGKTGHLRSEIDWIDVRAAAALKLRRAGDRVKALAEIAAFAAKARASHDLVALQWRAHLDALQGRDELGSARS